MRSPLPGTSARHHALLPKPQPLLRIRRSAEQAERALEDVLKLEQAFFCWCLNSCLGITFLTLKKKKETALILLSHPFASPLVRDSPALPASRSFLPLIIFSACVRTLLQSWEDFFSPLT